MSMVMCTRLFPRTSDRKYSRDLFLFARGYFAGCYRRKCAADRSPELGRLGYCFAGRSFKQVLRIGELHDLDQQIGNDIVTASGTTLLRGRQQSGRRRNHGRGGVFDANPEIRHGVIKILFTPDEEVGRGTEKWICKSWELILVILSMVKRLVRWKMKRFPPMVSKLRFMA
jgi:hypothetical protein